MTLSQIDRRHLLQAAVDLATATEDRKIDQGMVRLLDVIENVSPYWSDAFTRRIMDATHTLRCMSEYFEDKFNQADHERYHDEYIAAAARDTVLHQRMRSFNVETLEADGEADGEVPGEPPAA